MFLQNWNNRIELKHPHDNIHILPVPEKKVWLIVSCYIYLNGWSWKLLNPHESSLLEDLQSVTKIYIYLFLKYAFFVDISGTTWAIKKVFTSNCILVWRAFRWKNYFSNLVTKSADIFKNAVLPEKSKLFEKIHHFEKIKNFFHGSKV